MDRIGSDRIGLRVPPSIVTRSMMIPPCVRAFVRSCVGASLETVVAFCTPHKHGNNATLFPRRHQNARTEHPPVAEITRRGRPGPPQLRHRCRHEPGLPLERQAALRLRGGQLLVRIEGDQRRRRLGQDRREHRFGRGQAHPDGKRLCQVRPRRPGKRPAREGRHAPARLGPHAHHRIRPHGRTSEGIAVDLYAPAGIQITNELTN
mmetsp:Transcript_30519/g.65482  ORF Transcript_30519/g.65482 Transcript_30519/m.65482 type:complete len:206 (+) Transcript_30519:182-799(+)